jgi:hypothetical protein
VVGSPCPQDPSDRRAATTADRSVTTNRRPAKGIFTLPYLCYETKVLPRLQQSLEQDAGQGPVLGLVGQRLEREGVEGLGNDVHHPGHAPVELVRQEIGELLLVQGVAGL